MFQLRGGEGRYEIKVNEMSLGSKAILGFNHVSLEEPNGHKVFTFKKVAKGYYTITISNGNYYFDRLEVNQMGQVSLNTAFLSKSNDAIFSMVVIENGQPVENAPFQLPQIAYPKEPLFG